MDTKVYENQKPLAKYPAKRTFILGFLNPKTSKSAFGLAKAAWINFYIIQQKQKFGISKTPVVNVDHPLDEKIPFATIQVKIYLDFVSFFLRITAMIKKSFEKNIGLKLSADYLDFLAQLYTNAGTIYSKTFSTTNRPHYKKNLRFLTIHAFDPHLLCVPSLHIAIVAGSYAFVRKIFSNENLIISDEEKSRLLKEIYDGAVAITESVLFVKQHSINCVATALYMLTSDFGESFLSEKDVLAFTSNIFIDNTKDTSEYIEENVKPEIRKYIFDLYKTLCTKKSENPQKTWQEPILEFLKEYKSI